MARALVGNRNGKEYAFRKASLPAFRRICEICMNYGMSSGDASLLRVAPLGGGANHSFVVECDGTKYVVKQTFHTNREILLKRLLFGSESRKMIASMRKAVRRGGGDGLFQKTLYLFECPAFAKNRSCVEIWSVSDFIEGEVLSSLPDKQEYVERIPVLLAEVARRGVFQTDLHSGNFIVTEDGDLRAIDIRISSSPDLALVYRMAFKCRCFLGRSMPTAGFGIFKKAAAFLGDAAFSLYGMRREFK